MNPGRRTSPWREYADRDREFLFSQFERLNELAVALGVRLLEIIEETAALTDELQKTSFGVVIFDVSREVSVEVIDSLSDEGDLGFSGARIFGIFTELFNGVGIVLFYYALTWHVLFDS